MELRSSAFDPNSPIPVQYTGDGEDVFPPLRWDDVPPETKEFALICADPDAPGPHPFLHWLVTGIPGRRRATAQTGAGGIEGTNDFGHSAYDGPLPPNGQGAHHYVFTLYALDDSLGIDRGGTLEELNEAMKGHVLERTELIGVYERNGT